MSELISKPALQYGKIAIRTPVVLAPMAGITNTAFRRLCREFGGGLYVSEMVTSRALVERTEESLRLVGHHESEDIRSVQLYGVDPKTIAEAVTMLVAEDRADHIDLNFGCPVPKVTRKGGGSALPWKRDLFRSIVHDAIAAAGSELDSFLSANIDWHVAVANASHNELLMGMMTALSRAIYTATENEGFITDTVRSTTLRAHRSITRAIREQDPDAALRRMTRHVHSYAEAALAVDERVDITLPADE